MVHHRSSWTRSSIRLRPIRNLHPIKTENTPTISRDREGINGESVFI
jgi:hypothetical protein